MGTAKQPNFIEQTTQNNLLNDVNVNGSSTFFPTRLVSPNVPVFIDIDGDSDLDAFIGAENGTVKYYENIGSSKKPSFIERTKLDNPFGGVIESESTLALVDIDNDGDIDAFTAKSSSPIRYYENIGKVNPPSFIERIEQNPFNKIEIVSSGHISLVDIDNDGALDAFLGNRVEVLNEYDETTTTYFIKYYKNTGSASQPVFKEHTEIINPLSDIEISYLSSLQFIDVDGDYDLDVFVNKVYYENTGSIKHPVFVKRFEQDNPLENMDVGTDNTPTLIDVDNDGNLEVFVTTSEGKVKYYDYSSLKEHEEQNNPFVDIMGIGENSVPILVDLDNDGDMDAFIESSGRMMKYYQNESNVNQPAFELNWQDNPFTGIEINSTTVVSPPSFVDIDNDNDLDAFFGLSQELPSFEFNGKDNNFRYYKNTGTINFPVFVEQKNALIDVVDVGGKSQPVLIDIDKDEDLDVFIGAADGKVYYYENIGTVKQPHFVEKKGQENPLVNAKGEFDSHPVFGDIDNDGDFDVFINSISNNYGSLLIPSSNGKSVIKYYENIGTQNHPRFLERIGKEMPLPILYSEGSLGFFNSLHLADFNNDEYMDILISTRDYELEDDKIFYYENIGTTGNPIFVEPSVPLLFSTDVNLTFIDFDNDDDLDVFATLLINDITLFSDITPEYRIEYYENTSLIDNVLPDIYALPKGGVYNNSRQITLNCLNNCEKIYYTLDGTTEAASAIEYTGPFEITANTILNFAAIDAQGNISEIRTEPYVIDTEPPEIEITWPEKDSNIMSLTSIDGKVNSKGSTKLDRIEVQVTNEQLYLYKSDNPFRASLTWLLVYKNYEPVSTSLAWLPVSFNKKWSYDTGTIPLPIGSYTIKARVFDKAGNVAEDQITIKNLVYTSLSIESHPTLLQNELLEVKGKLIRYPNTEALSKKIITITTTAPDGTKTSTDVVTDKEGKYTQYLPGFTHKGIYTLQASFEGDDFLQPSPSAPESETRVRVGSSAGYAILIQGKVQGDEKGALTYNKTLNRVYRKLKLMGFTDDNIRYFNYNTEQDIDGDGQNDDIFDVHRKMDIKTAIEEWSRDRINGSPAPLYIGMVDHGALETFYIHHENEDKNDDVITLNDLNQWLNTLESGLNETALKEPRVIIIGACYSGSFIHATPSSTLSKEGRIIITSADKGESSSRGFMKEPDGILTGELFIEQLFDGLVYGDLELNDGVPLNFKAAFEQATQNIEKFTNNPVTSIKNRFADNAVQHPLLDDNGDGKGNNMLFINGDGQQVDSLFLGVIPKEGINSDKRPAYILEVTPTLRLDETQTAATLFLIANNSDKVDRTGTGATVRIRPPSKRPDAKDGSEQITFEDLETVELIYNETADRFETTYSGFNEAGKYEIFYTVRDAITQDISPIQSSFVKNKVDSNTRSRVRSPTEFKLVSPADNNVQEKTVLIFDWEDSEDLDNGVSYTLNIAKDKTFEKDVYQQEELSVSMTYVENAENKPCGKKKNACLEDKTRYYWRVEAINNVGDVTVSDIWTFSTEDTNAPPGIASIQVYNALDYTPVKNVDFMFNQNPPKQIFADQGIYNFSLDFGVYQMWLTVPGYLPRRVRAKADFIPLEMTTGQATEINVFLEPCTGSSCENIQPAQFSLETKLLTIPTVKVPDIGDFSLQLQGDDSLTFTILMDKLTPLLEATDYVAYLFYDETEQLSSDETEQLSSDETEQWQLFIPRVKVVMPSGEEARYKVTMELVNYEPLQFELVGEPTLIQ
jgi:hypothetical protein